MSEFDFNELDPEIQISVHEFDQERVRLYDWLAAKVEHNVSVLAFDNEASHAVHEVTGKFVSSAFEISQRVESVEKSALLVADNWYSDEKERHDRFSSMMAEAGFYPPERPYIDVTVDTIFRNGLADMDVFVKGMYDDYYGSLIWDVSKLLSTAHELQERDIVAKTANLALSTPESKHIGTSFMVLKGISRAYAEKTICTLGNYREC
jgi:hypothetical protein